VVHRLWPVSNQQVVSTVTGLMGPRPVFIADGHHRYETALRYLEDLKAGGDAREPGAAASFVLMMLVSMNDPGLLVMPTHRLVSGLGGLAAKELAQRLHPFFQVEDAGQGEKGARSAWDLIQADGGQLVLGFGTTKDENWLVAKFKGDPQVMARLAPSHSPPWCALGVSILHILVLDRVLAPTGVPGLAYRYVHLLGEVIDPAQKRQCDLAVLVPPATVEHVAQIAANLEKMPPKSTYFYPKLLSGLVFNSLAAN
jgi:uncharacterized protein (DUF1015 family)